VFVAVGVLVNVWIRIRRECEACSYCAVKGSEPVMSKSHTPVTKSEILNIPAHDPLLLSSKNVYVTVCSARTFTCHCMQCTDLRMPYNMHGNHLQHSKSLKVSALKILSIVMIKYISSFPGSETGMNSFNRFDPAAGRWELLPGNCASPPSRSGFGLTALRNGSSWTFWLFGGLADSAYQYGKYSRHTVTV
jgi:hypothetical protein